MFAGLVWAFILTLFPTATNSPACNHHIGVKDTHSVGALHLSCLLQTSVLRQNILLNHNFSPKSFKTSACLTGTCDTTLHPLSRGCILGDSSSHGQHRAVPLTPTKCGCTASPPADQGSIPCLQVSEENLSAVGSLTYLAACSGAEQLPSFPQCCGRKYFILPQLCQHFQSALAL